MIKKIKTGLSIINFLFVILLFNNCEGMKGLISDKNPSKSFNAWQDFKDITIDAQTLGLSGDVHNYPLLLRLNTSNFPEIATLTKSGGADIRFSNSDDTPLSYEIENWVDSTSGVIWVLIDTVSNSSTTTIRMYYNNPNALSESNSELVFNTANNFQGVWHLAETSGTIAYDSTSNAFDGSLIGNTTSQSGYIGNAFYFDGSGDYIDTARVASDYGVAGSNSKTVSIWAYTQTMTTTTRNGLFDLGENASNAQFGLRVFSTNFWRCQFWGGDFEIFHTSLNTWVHLTLSYDGTTVRIYADGVEAANVPISLNTADTNPLRIGAYVQSTTFYTHHGRLDEMRLSNTARSADWIKLDYETQKNSQTIITVL